MQLGAFLAAYQPTLEPPGWITIQPPPQIGCHVATDSFSMVNGAERLLANVCQHDAVASRPRGAEMCGTTALARRLTLGVWITIPPFARRGSRGAVDQLSAEEWLSIRAPLK